MARIKKSIGMVIVLGVLLLSVVAVGLLKRTRAPFFVLAARDAVETVLATGRVVGEKTIPLSFTRAGRIAEELTADGQQVRAGQPLLRQESAVEETTLAQRRTALTVARLSLEKLTTTDMPDLRQKVRQARATAAFASDFFKRQTDLLAQRSIPQLQFDQANRDKELAEAALESAANQLRAVETTLKMLAELHVTQAENDVRRAEIDLGQIVLRSPFNGRIVEHLAHKGEFVNAGQKVITFIPATPRTYVEIQVDEASLGRLALGQKAVVTSPAYPGRTYPATVERIASIVDTQRGTFALRLMLDDRREELWPESSVSVQVAVGESRAALLLEQRFLVREGALAFVFTAVGGRARRASVRVEDLGNGLFGVREGLQAGDRILLPQGLKDGARIKPVPAA